MHPIPLRITKKEKKSEQSKEIVIPKITIKQARTMKANYLIEKGDVAVIRPLVYVREHMTKAFALAAQLPVINENCPACFEEV